MDRFWAKVAIRGPDECWLWLGAINASGRPSFSLDGRTQTAARVALTLDGRPPGDLFACHSCDNDICVNPAHLWAGTHTDNMRDKIAKGRDWNQRKTHCINGHPYDNSNTYRPPNGERQCRTCKITNQKLRRQAARS